MFEDIDIYISFVLIFAFYFVVLYLCCMMAVGICSYYYDEYKRMRYRQMGKNRYV